MLKSDRTGNLKYFFFIFCMKLKGNILHQNCTFWKGLNLSLNLGKEKGGFYGLPLLPLIDYAIFFNP